MWDGYSFFSKTMTVSFLSLQPPEKNQHVIHGTSHFGIMGFRKRFLQNLARCFNVILTLKKRITVIL